jgi:hypothetical protein
MTGQPSSSPYSNQPNSLPSDNVMTWESFKVPTISRRIGDCPSAAALPAKVGKLWIINCGETSLISERQHSMQYCLREMETVG